MKIFQVLQFMIMLLWYYEKHLSGAGAKKKKILKTYLTYDYSGGNQFSGHLAALPKLRHHIFFFWK